MEYRTQGLLLLVISITLLNYTELFACTKTSYVVGYSEFFPFMYEAGNAEEVKGLDIWLVKKVFEKAGCTARFVNMPWARMVKGIKNGVPDVVLVASKTEERSRYAYFSLPYRNEQMRFMVRKNEIQRWPLKKLEDVIKYKMRIAVIMDNWFGEKFSKLKENNEFKQLIFNVTEDSDRFSMLLSNRADAVLHDQIYLKAMAERLGEKDKIDFLPLAVNDAPVHFMFSKKTTPQEDLAIINIKLKDFKTSSEYKALFGEMKAHFHKD